MRPIQIFITRDEFVGLIDSIAAKDGLHAKAEGARIEITKNESIVAEAEIGASSSEELCESVISFTEDASLFSDAKKIKKHLKQKLGVGVWFVNKDLAVKEFYKEWLYSDGVEKLAARGVRLVQFSGAKNFALIDRDASSRYSGVRGRIIDSA